MAAPGRGRPLALILAFLALTLAFAVAAFPYARLAPLLVQALSAASGARVELGTVSGGLGFTGPRIRAAPVRLQWPGAPPLLLDSVSMRPALSWSWLRGAPALALRGEAPGLRVAGTVWPRDGKLRGALGLDEASAFVLPVASPLPGGRLPLSGPLRVDVDLSGAPGQGTLDLAGEAGAVSAPGMPIALPYDELAARLVLAPGAWRIAAARLSGPLAELSLSGTVVPLADPTLDLKLDIQRIDPAAAGALRGLGIRVPAAGGSLRIAGPASRPTVR